MDHWRTFHSKIVTDFWTRMISKKRMTPTRKFILNVMPVTLRKQNRSSAPYLFTQCSSCCLIVLHRILSATRVRFWRPCTLEYDDGLTARVASGRKSLYSSKALGASQLIYPSVIEHTPCPVSRVTVGIGASPLCPSCRRNVVAHIIRYDWSPKNSSLIHD